MSRLRLNTVCFFDATMTTASTNALFKYEDSMLRQTGEKLSKKDPQTRDTTTFFLRCWSIFVLDSVYIFRISRRMQKFNYYTTFFYSPLTFGGTRNLLDPFWGPTNGYHVGCLKNVLTKSTWKKSTPSLAWTQVVTWGQPNEVLCPVWLFPLKLSLGLIPP